MLGHTNTRCFTKLNITYFGGKSKRCVAARQKEKTISLMNKYGFYSFFLKSLFLSQPIQVYRKISAAEIN